jgi:hypothetical protein
MRWLVRWLLLPMQRAEQIQALQYLVHAVEEDHGRVPHKLSHIGGDASHGAGSNRCEGCRSGGLGLRSDHQARPGPHLRHHRGARGLQAQGGQSQLAA